MTPDAPKLDCPQCGEPLIEAHGRGGHLKDGEFVEHRDGCRCHWCDWVWYDDRDPVACVCGTRVVVEIDDDVAYASEASTGT